MSAYVQRAILRELRKGRHHVPRVMKTTEEREAPKEWDRKKFVRLVQAAAHRFFNCGQGMDQHLAETFVTRCGELTRNQFAEVFRCFRAVGDLQVRQCLTRGQWDLILESACDHGLATPEEGRAGAYVLAPELACFSDLQHRLWLDDLKRGETWTPDDD